MPAEADDLEDAARSYERTLGEVLAGEPLDVCLLGMGEDGHVASLFPNHAGLDETRRVFAVYDSPKPPQRRLTLSLGEISTARMIVVLALGAEKAAIAAQAWRGPDRGLPVSLLPPERTHWYLDAAARSAAGDGWRGER
jgi:6-phosphogluconolactonase